MWSGVGLRSLNVIMLYLSVHVPRPNNLLFFVVFTSTNRFTEVPHECHAVSNHRQLAFLFDSLFILATTKQQINHQILTVPSSGEPTDYHKGPVMRNALPFHKVIVSMGIHPISPQWWLFPVLAQPRLSTMVSEGPITLRILLCCPNRQKYFECF